MTDDERLTLEAYHDGELGGLARWRMERRLARSSQLRAELDELRNQRDLLGTLDEAWDEPGPAEVEGNWAAIAVALPAIDAQVDAAPVSPRAEASEPAGAPEWLRWRWAAPVAAAAAALALAIVVGRTPPAPEVPLAASAPIASGGAVRYLDTAGRSVMVIEEAQEDLTILWMMDEA